MTKSTPRSPKPVASHSPPPEEGDLIRRRFVQRVTETIFTDYFGRQIYNDYLYSSLTSWVSHAVGSQSVENKNLAFYVGDDYERCQKALEACAEILSRLHNKEYARQFDQLLTELIQACGGDLGIRWERGRFSKIP